ncbi:hypothetical protein [Rhodoferax sp.]|nr:hypothetical protein [Rhodoferax sp.]MDD2809258.1 hypothetical protein [Rhodoferax sp.]
MTPDGVDAEVIAFLMPGRKAFGLVIFEENERTWRETLAGLKGLRQMG